MVGLTVWSWQELREEISDAGGGLSLLRVAGGCGSCLSGQRVHGTQELIRNASGLSEPAEQGAVDCGGVIPDGVLPREEETRDRLRAKEENHSEIDVGLSQHNEELKENRGLVREEKVW